MSELQIKTVYQCDDDGWFVGTTEAFESPLEPGVFLVPRAAVEVPPPEGPWPTASHPRWVRDRWVLQAPQQGGV